VGKWTDGSHGKDKGEKDSATQWEISLVIKKTDQRKGDFE
jgi:hypothetical protein